MHGHTTYPCKHASGLLSSLRPAPPPFLSRRFLHPPPASLPVTSPAEQAVENANLAILLFHLKPFRSLLFDTSHAHQFCPQPPRSLLPCSQLSTRHLQTSFSSGLCQAWTLMLPTPFLLPLHPHYADLTLVGPSRKPASVTQIWMNLPNPAPLAAPLSLLAISTLREIPCGCGP